MYLITGLGNPGRSYSNNRHNVGFMLVDLMAAEAGRKFKRRGSHSLTCSVERAGEEVILAKPQTYMNLSGRAVQELLEHYPVDMTQLLIVYDELALPLGTLRIRPSGSSVVKKVCGPSSKLWGPKTCLDYASGSYRVPLPMIILHSFWTISERANARFLKKLWIAPSRPSTPSCLMA